MANNILEKQAVRTPYWLPKHLVPRRRSFILAIHLGRGGQTGKIGAEVAKHRRQHFQNIIAKVFPPPLTDNKRFASSMTDYPARQQQQEHRPQQSLRLSDYMPHPLNLVRPLQPAARRPKINPSAGFKTGDTSALLPSQDQMHQFYFLFSLLSQMSFTG